MAIPVTIPYSFANATTTQNLSYLDANYNALANGLNGLANGTSQISISSISATGNANATTYLRGDGSWATVSGSGTVTSVNANSTVSGFTFTGGPVTTSGTLTLTGPSPGTSGNVLTSNGSAWSSSAGAYPLTSGTAVASTSGTSITFSSIPSWVKRITVVMNGVSTNGSSTYLIQVGSGSPQTTGYNGYSSRQGSTGSGYTALSSGFIASGSTASTMANYGSLTLTLLGSNTWVCTGMFTDTSTINNTINTVGSVALSGALDRVILTTVAGTDTFDAGSINILYE